MNLESIFPKNFDANNSDALYKLATRYELGKGVKKNIKTAFLLYKKSAKKNHTESQFSTGVLLAQGSGVKKDIDDAIYWWKKAAKNGHGQAQFNLGVSYYNGSSGIQNFSKAIRWFEKSAKLKNTRATFFLARELYSGVHITQNFNRAFRLFSIAAKSNLIDAQIDLGLMYTIGQGVDKPDPVTGYAWIGLAVSQGANHAKKILTDIENDFELNRRDLSKALKLQKRLAKKYA